MPVHSETVSIPTNPRTTRPVGYAFVDVSTATEGERAIAELNGKSILDRTVSVQLARKPEESAANGERELKRRGSRSAKGKARTRPARGPRNGRVRFGNYFSSAAYSSNVPVTEG